MSSLGFLKAKNEEKLKIYYLSFEIFFFAIVHSSKKKVFAYFQNQNYL